MASNRDRTAATRQEQSPATEERRRAGDRDRVATMRQAQTSFERESRLRADALRRRRRSAAQADQGLGLDGGREPNENGGVENLWEKFDIARPEVRFCIWAQRRLLVYLRQSSFICFHLLLLVLLYNSFSSCCFLTSLSPFMTPHRH